MNVCPNLFGFSWAMKFAPCFSTLNCSYPWWYQASVTDTSAVCINSPFCDWISCFQLHIVHSPYSKVGNFIKLHSYQTFATRRGMRHASPESEIALHKSWCSVFCWGITNIMSAANPPEGILPIDGTTTHELFLSGAIQIFFTGETSY